MRALLIAAAIYATSGFIGPSQANETDAAKNNFTGPGDTLFRRRPPLQQFCWNTHTVVSLNGQVRNIIRALCRYGPDGTVYATPLGTPPLQTEPRGLRRRATETQADDVEGSVKEMMALAHHYVPPALHKLEAFFQNATALFIKKAGSNETHLYITDYLKPGDSIVLGFEPLTRSLSTIDVTTYLAEETDILTLHVVFQSLPDGTNYVASSVLNAIARHIQVTTENENYRRLWQ